MPTSLYGPYTGPQLFRVCNIPNRKTLFCIYLLLRVTLYEHARRIPSRLRSHAMNFPCTNASRKIVALVFIKTAKEDSGDQLSRTDLLLGLVKLVS